MEPEIVDVRALPHTRVWVRFRDGAEGIVDLTHLRGLGVFRAWDAPGFFERVAVNPETGSIAWPGEIDLDPDVLYSEVTGKPLPGQQDLRAAS